MFEGISLQMLGAQAFTGLVLGALYVLLAIGLSLIFGLLRVPNFAHGALYMFGAFLGFTLLSVTKNFGIAMLGAALGVGVFGLFVERFLLRRLYERSIDDAMLLTFGISLVLVEAVRLIWGKRALAFDQPATLSGAVDFGFGVFPVYRLFIIGFVAVVVLLLWLFLTRTNLGLIIRAGARDPLMVRGLGFDFGKIQLLVFALGAGFAGLAGVLVGPLGTVYPEMGVNIIVECFVVVVVGGMGSLLGAVVSALIIGEAISLTTLFAPKFAHIVIFIVMAIVLLTRPQGLFGEATVEGEK